MSSDLRKTIELPYLGITLHNLPEHITYRGLEKPWSEKWSDFLVRARKNEAEFIREMREKYGAVPA